MANSPEMKEMKELEVILSKLNDLGAMLEKNQIDTRNALARIVPYQEPATDGSGVVKSEGQADDMVWKLNNVIKAFQRLVSDSETIRNHVNRLA